MHIFLSVCVYEIQIDKSHSVYLLLLFLRCSMLLGDMPGTFDSISFRECVCVCCVVFFFKYSFHRLVRFDVIFLVFFFISVEKEIPLKAKTLKMEINYGRGKN